MTKALAAGLGGGHTWLGHQTWLGNPRPKKSSVPCLITNVTVTSVTISEDYLNAVDPISPMFGQGHGDHGDHGA